MLVRARTDGNTNKDAESQPGQVHGVLEERKHSPKRRVSPQGPEIAATAVTREAIANLLSRLIPKSSARWSMRLSRQFVGGFPEGCVEMAWDCLPTREGLVADFLPQAENNLGQQVAAPRAKYEAAVWHGLTLAGRPPESNRAGHKRV
jgi:hypothetical protein